MSDKQITTAPEPIAATDHEKLVRDNYGWMLVLARDIVGDHALAEDVVQEALINAVRGLDKFKQRSRLQTWLRRITINQAITKLRQLDRIAEEEFDEYQPEFDKLDCRIEAKWATLPTPERILEQQGTQALIEQAFAKLPESYRLVVRLRDIEGYDTREVAELLSVSENNVKVRLHRARAALKKLLEPVLRREDSKEKPL
ncbi:MAG: sigma-70 family RNA polymerase sigma factor [Pseudomonadota bacterium]